MAKEFRNRIQLIAANHTRDVRKVGSIVFQKSFFADRDNGFLAWMNSIRNSGPFCTRIAVYPNDYSDILNEERFGAIVNLNYNVRVSDEYEQFRDYALRLTDKYLASVSIDQNRPAQLDSILNLLVSADTDPLEQLIYAADGSSRRN